MTFLWDLYDTPHIPSYRKSINYCFYLFIWVWLKINQFADLDGFAGLKAGLNKISRELSTESVDTFDGSYADPLRFFTADRLPEPDG